MSGVMITDDGVRVHKWSVTREGDRWTVVSSQRCCAWRAPDQALALRLVDQFEWAHAHPELPDPEDLGMWPHRPGGFKAHLRHMREGVVYPMKAEDFV